MSVKRDDPRHIPTDIRVERNDFRCTLANMGVNRDVPACPFSDIKIKHGT